MVKRTPIKRKKPIKRSKLRQAADRDRLERRGYPLKRKTPIKPVNRKRRAKRFEANFGGKERVEAIKRMPCAWAMLWGTWGEGHSCRGEIHNAHTKTRGAGGKAEDVVPLCDHHHAVFDGRETCEYCGLINPAARSDMRRVAHWLDAVLRSLESPA